MYSMYNRGARRSPASGPATRRPGDRSDGPPRPFAEIGSVPHRDRSARALRRLGRCRTPLRAEASIHLTKHAEKPEPATAVWPTTAPATPQWARRPMRWSARTRPGASPARTGTTPSDTGNSCPNLTQRHPALESSVEKSPEYQRFSSRSPIGSGPLRQIWTRGAHLRHLTRSRGRPVTGTPGTGAPVPTTTAQRQAHDSATDPDMSISRAASGEGRATSRRSHRAPAASWPESSPRVELEEHDIPPKILSKLRGSLRSDDGTDAEIPEETLRTPQRSLVLFRTGAQLVLTTHDTPPSGHPSRSFRRSARPGCARNAGGTQGVQSGAPFSSSPTVKKQPCPTSSRISGQWISAATTPLAPRVTALSKRPVRNHATGNRESPSPLRRAKTGRAAIEPGNAHIRIRDTMNRADRYIY